MLHSLQSCRALATILVVIFHANHSIFNAPKYFGYQPVGSLFDFGPSAIDFFFVLSGFILTYVHKDDINRPRALVGYLWRRYSRAYLFYWLVLAAVVPIFFAFPHFGYGDERTPDLIVRSIFLLPHPETRTVIIASWTMVYEVFFFAMFGVLILNRRLGVALFIAWMAGCLLVPHTDNYLLNFAFSDKHLRFAAGILACLAIQRWRIPGPRVVFAFGSAIFLLTAVNHDLDGPLSQTAMGYCYTLGSAIALAGLVECERSGLLRGPRFLTHVGDAAFAIYLTHFPALSVLAKIAKAMHLDHYVPGLALFVLHVVGAIGIGMLCHRLLENPIHQWSKRFFRRAKTAAAAAVISEPELQKAA
jgi:peptidoglycan/LPS O-acetylase OafA/YrhL